MLRLTGVGVVSPWTLQALNVYVNEGGFVLLHMHKGWGLTEALLPPTQPNVDGTLDRLGRLAHLRTLRLGEADLKHSSSLGLRIPGRLY